MSRQNHHHRIKNRLEGPSPGPFGVVLKQWEPAPGRHEKVKKGPKEGLPITKMSPKAKHH